MRSIVEQDAFARLVGIELVEVGPGTATCRLVLGPQHLNGMGILQGGVLFTLADLAFAAACNSYDIPAVAVNANISFLKAVKSGTLTAEAVEVRAGKMGAYTIRVFDETGDVVALFQGLCYRKQPSRPAP